MEDLISFNIRVNGSVIPDDLLVTSIVCTSRFHHNSIAEITFACTTNEIDNVSNAVTDVLKFSNEVTIEAGYEGHNKVIFTGIVSAQRVMSNELNNLFVIITCKGKAPVSINDTTVSPNAALALTYGDNIMSLDFSADKNQALTAGNLKETKGVVKFQGTSAAEAGSVISITNIGDNFNKTYLATGIIHQISNGNWITEAHLALKESI